MNRIDETRTFIPLRIAVLTVSDTRTQKTDKSGPLLAQFIEDAGHVLADRAVVEDDEKAIRKQVKKWIKDKEIDAVITTGGSGEAAIRERDRRVLHHLSHAKLSDRRHLDGAEQSLRRLGRRYVYLLPAWFAGRLRGRLVGHPGASIRQPPPALQLHRGDAAA